MRFDPVQIVSSGDMSANITSSSVDVNQLFLGAIHAVWTGSPVGTLQLQVSNDASTWSTYSGTSQAAGGGAGDFMWNLTYMGFRYIRLTYTASSGTGTLNVKFTGKG